MLGRVGKEPSDGDEEGEANDIALPFSPEVGSAAAFDGGFAVGALLPSKAGATAVVVMLSPGGNPVRKLELGVVHGDVPPPRVAASGASLVVAVSEGAPHGSLARLSRIDVKDAMTPAAVTPGAVIPQGAGDSEAMALEIGKKSALLAWDEWDAKAGHEVIKAVSFAPSSPEKAAPPVVVSAKDVDAEAPRLARRASGFWAAWIVTAHPPHPTPATAKPLPMPEDDKREKAGTPESPEPQYIELAPLDADGALAGKPLAVSPKSGHVAAFDLAATKDDGALVVWRDAVTRDEQTPGGTVRLALVRADGSVEPRALVEEDVGSGVPLLLPDDAPVAGTAAFMAVAGDNGAVRLASLDESGRGKDALALDSELGVATPLAARGGVLFVARPHGGGVDLSLLACSAGAAPLPR